MSHRISTSRPEDGCSLEYRSGNTLALAESLGLAVAPEHILDEVGSGADPFRPSCAQLWKLAEGCEVAYVLAYRTDRLARDEIQVASPVRHCLDHEVGIRFADGTRVEPDNDEMVRHVLAGRPKTISDTNID